MISQRTLPFMCLGAVLLGTGLSVYSPKDLFRARSPRTYDPGESASCPEEFPTSPRWIRLRRPELVLARWSGALLHQDSERVAVEEERILRRQEKFLPLLMKMAAEDPEERIRSAAGELLSRFGLSCSADPGVEGPGDLR
jgi:hypothetical protein